MLSETAQAAPVQYFHVAPPSELTVYWILLPAGFVTVSVKEFSMLKKLNDAVFEIVGFVVG